MASFLAIAMGLAFTLVVCLAVLRALLEPWLRIRQKPAAPTQDIGDKLNSRATRTRGAQPLHTA